MSNPVKIVWLDSEKADIANGIDALIRSAQRAHNSAVDPAVKDAHAGVVKRLQALFVKVRQSL